MRILHVPNEILLSVCEPVTGFAEVQEAQKKMRRLMKAEHGVGLAAPQVGIAKRFFVEASSGVPRVIINPTIVKHSETSVKSVEGCLSIPNKKFEVIRHQWIVIEFDNLMGERIRELADGFSSVVLQHESDHLDGILISERGKECLA